LTCVEYNADVQTASAAALTGPSSHPGRAIHVRYPGGAAKPGFPAVPGGAEPGGFGGGATVAAAPSFAQLEAFQHAGKQCYRDPETGTTPRRDVRPAYDDKRGQTDAPAPACDQLIRNLGFVNDIVPRRKVTLTTEVPTSSRNHLDLHAGLVYLLVDDRRLGPRLELAPFRTTPGRGSRTVISGPGAGTGRGSAARSGPNPADRLFEALDAALKEHRVGGWSRGWLGGWGGGEPCQG
jgi:hypothetical protein